MYCEFLVLLKRFTQCVKTMLDELFEIACYAFNNFETPKWLHGKLTVRELLEVPLQIRLRALAPRTD